MTTRFQSLSLINRVLISLAAMVPLVTGIGSGVVWGLDQRYERKGTQQQAILNTIKATQRAECAQEIEWLRTRQAEGLLETDEQRRLDWLIRRQAQ